jgi:cation:H+ antiporter
VSGFSSVLLVIIFLAGAAITWVAGVFLSKTTDSLDERLHLGAAVGGMVLLAVAGSLPEAAITVSAALAGHLDIAAGNIAGGIAMQTMVLVVCDAFVAGKKPLSYLVGSLIPVLEAALVIVTVSIVLMGTLLPASVALGGVSPASVFVIVVWVLGMYMLNKVRNSPKWQITMPGSKSGRPHRQMPHPERVHPYAHLKLKIVWAVFAGACGVTLIGGVALQMAGSELASRAGINGVVFGATFLALASALPEISSGIAAVRLGDHQLVMGDIFGGNAFQLCLFLVADLIAGKPAMPASGMPNTWLAGLGIVLTAIYAASVVLRPERRMARIGLDSIIAVIIFAVGLIGLTAIHT